MPAGPTKSAKETCLIHEETGDLSPQMRSRAIVGFAMDREERGMFESLPACH